MIISKRLKVVLVGLCIGMVAGIFLAMLGEHAFPMKTTTMTPADAQACQNVSQRFGEVIVGGPCTPVNHTLWGAVAVDLGMCIVIGVAIALLLARRDPKERKVS